MVLESSLQAWQSLLVLAWLLQIRVASWEEPGAFFKLRPVRGDPPPSLRTDDRAHVRVTAVLGTS